MKRRVSRKPKVGLPKDILYSREYLSDLGETILKLRGQLHDADTRFKAIEAKAKSQQDQIDHLLRVTRNHSIEYVKQIDVFDMVRGEVARSVGAKLRGKRA